MMDKDFPSLSNRTPPPSPCPVSPPLHLNSMKCDRFLGDSFVRQAVQLSKEFKTKVKLSDPDSSIDVIFETDAFR